MGVINTGKWVKVLLGYSVQPAIVHTETPATVLLADQNNRCSPRTTGGLDDSRSAISRSGHLPISGLFGQRRGRYRPGVHHQCQSDVEPRRLVCRPAVMLQRCPLTGSAAPPVSVSEWMRGLHCSAEGALALPVGSRFQSSDLVSVKGWSPQQEGGPLVETAEALASNGSWCRYLSTAATLEFYHSGSKAESGLWQSL